MDFFNSLTLDLKFLVIGIAGFALLAVFSGNRNSEKRYLVVLAALAAVGVYRFTHLPGDEQPQRSATRHSVPSAAAAPPQRTPLVSTSAR